MEELSYAAKLRATAEAAKPKIEADMRKEIDAYIANVVMLCIRTAEQFAAIGRFACVYETYMAPSSVTNSHCWSEVGSQLSCGAIAVRIREQLIAKGFNTVKVVAKPGWHTFNIKCEW